MMKLFISQPMRGKSDEDILKEREVAINLVKKYLNEEIEVLDSFIRDCPKDKIHTALYYLGKSLEILSEADLVYFAPGWGESRGCIIERSCAISYGLEILDINNIE